MKNPYDNPDLKKYLDHAEKEMLPAMKGSAMSMIIWNDPDIKLCLEFGAAVLYDKPIIVVVPLDKTLPSNVARVAAAIIQGSIDDPETKEKLQKAVRSVLENDTRIRRKVV